MELRVGAKRRAGAGTRDCFEHFESEEVKKNLRGGKGGKIRKSRGLYYIYAAR